MAEHPPVYSDHDRHQVLIAIARKVAAEVIANPHPNDHQDTYNEHLAINHTVASGK